MKNQVVPPPWPQTRDDCFRFWRFGSRQPGPSRKNRSAEDLLAVMMFSGLRFALLDVFVIV